MLWGGVAANTRSTSRCRFPVTCHRLHHTSSRAGRLDALTVWLEEGLWLGWLEAPLVGATFSFSVLYAVISFTNSAVHRFLAVLSASFSSNHRMVAQPAALPPSLRSMRPLPLSHLASHALSLLGSHRETDHRHHLLSSFGVLVEWVNACLLKGRDDVPGTHDLKIGRACHAGNVVLRDRFTHILPHVICALAVVVALKSS